MFTNSTLLELFSLLSALSPSQIWRPVPGPDGTLLVQGSGPDVDTLKTFVDGLDFAGKSVIDLGCNLGFFTFLACRLGAVSALGLDIDPKVIEAARLLAQLHGLEGARFEVRDFLRDPGENQVDLVLGIDFIGRSVVAKGRLRDVLRAADGLARKEIFLTFHPVYNLGELGGDTQELREMYDDFIRQGRLHLAECVASWLGRSWSARQVNQGKFEGRVFKAAMLFTRIPDLG